MSMRRLKFSALVSILLLIVPGRLFAQGARISGLVQDQSGATIPNATVTLRKGTETKTTVTNSDGSFSFNQVAAGTYDVEADQPGFKPGTVRVAVGNRNPRPIEFKLQIATLQQELTVGGDDVEVSTQT